MFIVSKMLLTLYDMVYCGVLVDCVQDVTYILRYGLLWCLCLLCPRCYLHCTTWSTAVSLLIVYKMLLTLYDMVYCNVLVDCVQDVTYILRHGLLWCLCLLCPRCYLHCTTWSTAVSLLIVSKMLLTLCDMVRCGVNVDCVQDVAYIVRHGLLRCPC